MANQFSLAGLDDHLSPSQQCIKPLQVLNRSKKQKVDKEVVSISMDDGGYYETNETGEKKLLDEVQISLNDCLACSGCITSAESVLITQQSKTEFFNVLEQQPQRVLVVTISPQSRASIATYYGIPAKEAFQKLTTLFKQLGAKLVIDSSFSRDFSLSESVSEFVDRYQTQNKEKPLPLPLLASSCPGWICYAEKTQAKMLPYISKVKSPQQIMGTLVKDYWASQLRIEPEDIYHVSIMPCFDKKLEASRDDFYNEIHQTRDVDTVLTSAEVIDIIKDKNIPFKDLPDSPLNERFIKVNGKGELTGIGGGSGGYAEYIIRKAAEIIFGVKNAKIHSKQRKNIDFVEKWIEVDGKQELHFALAYGFRNIQTIARMVKSRKGCPFLYVEIMACPGGCNNGGGQIKPSEEQNAKDLLATVEETYHKHLVQEDPSENTFIQTLYQQWIPTPNKQQEKLYTQYHEIPSLEKELTAAIQW